MNLLEAALLGVVQGVTEFLPVSSSGHLVLGQALFGIEIPGVVFEVTVHLATLCAVCWVYRTLLAALVRGVSSGDRDSLRYVALLAVATLPAAVVGVGFGDALAGVFERPVIAAAMLLVTGVLVWSIRHFARRTSRHQPTVRGAVGIGLAQAAAILPGISRSGSTVAAATAAGVEPRHAAEFSFLLSIPAIAGAAVLQAPALGEAGSALGAVPLGVAFVTAALSGVLAIRIFLRMLERRVFHHFAWYCWVVGGAYLAAAGVWPALRG
ncbi:undecaprenyl-diphosphate phosphatase [Candidatus Palauibacter sp.]|uniref:undecaprenyl-diphosphate phosphatase n=1 Tax=Candidatus Palauibacter sp. TaxID=3101350 RepID=UPI003AF2BA93